VIGEVVRRIGERIDLRRARALEVFARAGDWHVTEYADLVGHLTAWELNPEFEADLRRNLPRADVQIVDSYTEITRTPGRFDLVVLDNFLLTVDHVEHFDLFPAVYRVLTDRAFLVRIVVPDPYRYSEDVPEAVKHGQRRFYDHPSEVVPREVIETTYARLAAASGRSVTWTDWTRRNQAIWYLTEELVPA